MLYNSLNELVSHSRSSRRYFLSLPVSMQLALHEHNLYIHSAADLHARVDAIEHYNRAVEISKLLF